jgi:hypothetical protein
MACGAARAVDAERRPQPGAERRSNMPFSRGACACVKREPVRKCGEDAWPPPPHLKVASLSYHATCSVPTVARGRSHQRIILQACKYSNFGSRFSEDELRS